MRQAIEDQVGAKQFSIAKVATAAETRLRGVHDCGLLIDRLREQVTNQEFTYLLRSLVRNSFIIEVDVNGSGTKLDSRWGERLPTLDSRRASYEECCRIFELLLRDLVASLDFPERRDLVLSFVGSNVIPYELPVDYANRTTPIHRVGNLVWLWDRPAIQDAIHLRRAMTNSTVVGEEVAKAVSTILGAKIKVKTYLTDRALTGEYKTNREKRWEANPNSPQFATRADCILIERELLTQLAYMEGFPEEQRVTLRESGVLEDREPTRCPVTLDRISYLEFVTEVLNPVHGKSKFQVGHLNPLKGDASAEIAGHTPENVSWITEDGNRIQGYYSLAEVRALLERITRNYETVKQTAGG